MTEEKKEKITVIEITEEYLREKLYKIRGQRVILDSDLSEIYGYTTKAFNQQVKNNKMAFLFQNRFTHLFRKYLELRRSLFRVMRYNTIIRKREMILCYKL